MSDCLFCHEDHCILRAWQPQMKCPFEVNSSEIGYGLCTATDLDLVEVELDE